MGSARRGLSEPLYGPCCRALRGFAAYAAAAAAAETDAGLEAGAGALMGKLVWRTTCSLLADLSWSLAALLFLRPEPGGTLRSVPPDVQYRWHACLDGVNRAAMVVTFVTTCTSMRLHYTQASAKHKCQVPDRNHTPCRRSVAA